ncbi:RES family NAD+ phosphorylase [Yersinia proxima]|uniref:RES family NAD+ phosphorylase n=1 Tax=Yersinia proxima TaxID=2890316 RepID=UPI003D69338B
MIICIDHILEENIKFVINKDQIFSDCCVCGGSQKICLDTESYDVQTMMKSLIRYNYDEFKYNDHVGGDETFHGLLLDDGFIFSDDVLSNNEVCDDLNDELYSIIEVYGNIPIFAGYSDGQQNMLLEAIKNQEVREIRSLQEKLEKGNHFEHEGYIKEIISSYGNSFLKKITENNFFYRARVGYSNSKIAYDGFNRKGQSFYAPYVNDDISAVPPLLADQGRANRAGVSFLYCATDMNTAIAEVRPHPTDIVSVAEFVNMSDLEVFDFSYPNLIDFYDSEDKLDSMRMYATMANIFNKATPPSLKGRYILSQLISDCIRQQGYDGILFSSTVGEGKNLVVFTPEKMKFVDGSDKILEVEKVEYTSKECKVIGRDDEFEVYV